ncbi:hypothetical protein BpHYR1_034996 [Brachionus plicatilis]|uniref:Uncharacterized protein n=1 Tax=Brachionus plicatilis TaxID=10195 RepID=A0A3M7R9D3_BRAPC|nr:hypothetical protein BpHYR1_034996 [Brachionus plicatilis]
MKIVDSCILSFCLDIIVRSSCKFKEKKIINCCSSHPSKRTEPKCGHKRIWILILKKIIPCCLKAPHQSFFYQYHNSSFKSHGQI